MNRYTTNGEEGEILPNLLGITDEETLHNAEFEGFLMAEILFTEKLTPKTKFSVKYICDIHRTALKELYSFAGRFRSVNISKGGFVFPAGRFIPDSMRIFEEEILSQLPDHYTSQQALIKDIAKVHGELLFIHPFQNSISSFLGNFYPFQLKRGNHSLQNLFPNRGIFYKLRHLFFYFFHIHFP